MPQKPYGSGRRQYVHVFVTNLRLVLRRTWGSWRVRRWTSHRTWPRTTALPMPPRTSWAP